MSPRLFGAAEERFGGQQKRRNTGEQARQGTDDALHSGGRDAGKPRRLVGPSRSPSYVRRCSGPFQQHIGEAGCQREQIRRLGIRKVVPRDEIREAGRTAREANPLRAHERNSRARWRPCDVTIARGREGRQPKPLNAPSGRRRKARPRDGQHRIVIACEPDKALRRRPQGSRVGDRQSKTRRWSSATQSERQDRLERWSRAATFTIFANEASSARKSRRTK